MHPRQGGPGGATVPSIRRRQLLGTLAASGTLAIAGCGGGGNAGGEGTEGPEYTFLADIQPTEVNWARPPPPLDLLLYPPGQTVAPDGEVVEHVVESTEIDPGRVRLRIREDVTWSNGDPVLAKDLGRWFRMFRALGPDPQRVERGEVVPDDWRFAVTGVEWDGRELVATTPDGLLQRLTTPFDVWSFFNARAGSTPRAYFDGMYSTYTEKYADPWASEKRHENAKAFLGVGLSNPAVANPDLRDPANVVSCGPWQVDRVAANGVRMRPHPGHPTVPRAANWQHLLIEPVTNINKAAAALKANAGDAFQPKLGGTNRFFSPNTSATFPQNFRQWDGKALEGQGLLLNRSNEVLADRRVRAALLSVATPAELAESGHSIGERPVDVPGLAAVDEGRLPDAVASGLRRYGPDRDRAAELLRAAGFSRSNGTWHGPDGSRFELPVLRGIPTRLDRPAPLLVQAFVSRLGEFGIEARMLPLEQTVAQKRFEAGDFVAALHTWPVLLGNGYPYHRAAWWYANAVGFGVNRRPQMGLFGEELTRLVDHHDSIGWTNPDRPETSGISVADPEPLKELTVEAPPVGEPDGSLREFPVVYLAIQVLTEWSWDGTDGQDATATLVWVYNYDLPYLELTRTVPQLYHDTADWNVPPPDDPVWRHDGPAGYPSAIAGALQRGAIEPRRSD